MYEIEAVILIIGLAYLHESILACVFILSTNLLLYTATMERADRINKGRWCLAGLITASTLIMLLKLAIAVAIGKYQNDERLSGKLENCFDINNFDNKWVAWGFNRDIIGAWVPVDGFTPPDSELSFPSKNEYVT